MSYKDSQARITIVYTCHTRTAKLESQEYIHIIQGQPSLNHNSIYISYKDSQARTTI